MDVRHDLDGLVDVVEDDEGRGDHEKGLGQTGDRVGEGSDGLGGGLEMGYRVVGDEPDSST